MPPDTEQTADGLHDDGNDIEFYGGRLVSALPLALFVAWAIFQSGVLQVSDTSGLVVGMLGALVVGMFFTKGSWAAYANTIFEGMTQRVAATAIVAWLWAGMFAQLLQDGGFVQGLVWAADVSNITGSLFPAATFLLAALFATGIGTGYGTTIAFTGLFYPAGLLLGANPVLLFGSILSGAVFGDNLAPVSDTTIVSAVTQDADIGGVVASRFKYAVVAAVPALAAYLVAGQLMPGATVSAGASGGLDGNALGLIHVFSMATVITLAVAGRHIVEAISWGIVVALAFNIGSEVIAEYTSLLGDGLQRSPALLFEAPQSAGLARDLAWLPFVELTDGTATVSGSLYAGALGFFPLIVLTLLIVAGARIMIRGGGFEALQDVLLSRVATNVRRAEATMVFGTALVNAMITINTAAEIAIAPYVARVGERFNINGYRRANILDANTSALGYIFPWAGGVLVGFATMQGLVQSSSYEWFTQSLVVNPIEVWPFVFHGWFLFATFVVAALSGYGLEYVSDRESEEVARV